MSPKKIRRYEEIGSISDFVDDEGILKIDIYSHRGLVLLKKGRKPHEADLTRGAYALREDYEEIRELEMPENRSSNLEEPRSTEEKRNGLIKLLGPDVLVAYDALIDYTSSLFNSKEFTKKSYEEAEKLVEANFNIEYNALIKCLDELRNADNYSLSHSVGVYFKSAMAFKDISRHQDSEKFLDVFKESHNMTNFDVESMKRHSLGALLHDLGKAKVPSYILRKEGTLTDYEFGKIKMHPLWGLDKLRDIGITDKGILEIVGNHHAKYLCYSPSGDPDPSNWVQGPLAQVVNIIDIFDACRFERSYKPAFDFGKTMAILEFEKGENQWSEFIYNILRDETLPKIDAEHSTIN